MTIDVKYELENIRPNLFLQETEDTWEKIAKALTSLIKLCDTGAYDTHPSDIVSMVRAAHRPIISAMNSERTRLCMVPMDLMVSLGGAMGMEFDQIMPLFIPTLLTNCARTNKVIVNRAKSTILSVIEVTQLAAILTHFYHNIKDKSSSMKIAISEGTLACLNSCNPPDLEKEARAVEIEGIIRITARDANADVRKNSRKIFESYTILLPARVQSFTAPLSPTTRKYLDVKPPTVTTQKSSSNLRSNITLKPEVKSKSSVGPSSSTGHSRTASSSTHSTATVGGQAQTQPTTLVRVSRKDPVPTVAPVPVRLTQPSRVAPEPAKVGPQRPITLPPIRTTGVQPIIRTTTVQETKRPIPPLRTQRSTASLTIVTKSSAPQRIQITTASTSAAAGSSSQALPSAGPRRIPMPPPPPPAPKKDTDGPKRPASRIDNGASTASHRSAAVPPAPVKKAASTVTSSLRDRVPSAKPPAKPTVNISRPKSSTATTTTSVAASTSGTSTTKAQAPAKAKPVWGKSAPPAKPAPLAAQKAATSSSARPVPPTNTRAPVKTMLTRKPSTRATSSSKVAGPPIKTSAEKPVIPENIALPPSPPPAEEGKDELVPEVEIAVQEKGDLNNDGTGPIADPALPDIVEPNQIDDEGDESSSLQANENSDVNTLSTIVAVQSSSMNNKENIPIPNVQHEIQKPEEAMPAGEEVQEDSDSLMLPEHENPRTPQQGLKPAPSADVNAGKTPISALLSSIERGFNYDYSPITPLSPADSYLPKLNGETPYSHHTHAPHIKGPMQPFNHALHAPGHGGIFGGFGGVVKPKEELVRGDIGVVQLSEYNKIYKPASLPGLDDGRQAFIELNKH
ncbi:Protein stu-1 [Psilocybe cubensis]|uniref:Protein stu-1 n=1 Tax=Psilocybe cubensis TaxID=181762 RepID=A0ACB8GWZ2_PSICU|nr:Protein stu-1 [Psilocybe cubensis]KAH9480265.1 Protein stu-1 [Psilocybe cubensis]